MADTDNKDKKKPKTKNEVWRTVRYILIGLLLGIIITCGVSFIYRTWWLKDYIETPIVNNKCDTSKEALIQSVEQLKVLNAAFVDKIDAVNKRLDDFLIFGGLIITLLLAISVSVYLNTEAEVDRHMKKDFSKNKQQIEDMNADAITTLNEIKSTLLMAQQNQKTIESMAKANKTTTPI